MDNQIRIEPIRVKDLIDFANEQIEGASPGQFIPISYQRALAHANNPVANPDDVALLVAIDEEDEVVGYFGVLPVALRNHGQVDKANWFTTWNVSSKVRGRGVGTQLMEYALTLEKDYLIVGSIHARRVCRKFGFFERVFRYYWLDMTGKERLNPVVWLRRGFRKTRNKLGMGGSGFPIQSDASRALDRVFSPYSKRWYYIRLLQSLEHALDGYSIKEVKRVEGADTPQTGMQVELYRSPEVVNWMLEYPWVLPPGESRTEHLDYFFSDVRALFIRLAYQVYDRDGRNLGYLVFQVSGKPHHVTVKVLDWGIDDRNANQIVLAQAIQVGNHYQADIIELPFQAGKAIPSSVHKIVLLHEKERVYQCHPKSSDSPLARAWPELEFKLADGDMPFS